MIPKRIQRAHLRDLTPDAPAALGLVLVAAFLLRTLWLSLPAGSLIFDEVYYVNAARVILGTPVDAAAPYHDAPAYLDPNTEHPPLGKALIAGSMEIFGDNAIGWRAPSVLAGMAAMLALYGIVRALGGRPWLGVTAVAMYSIDVLSFIHGRIGTLDMMSLALVLIGAWLGIRKRWVLAGTFVALGTLVKITGVYGLAALLLWQAVILWPLLRSRTLGWRALLPTASLVGAFLVVGLGGLWLLDLKFTQYATPFDHLARMFGYGFALQPHYTPNAITSAPWEWLYGNGQFNYLRTAVNTSVNGQVVGSRALVEFRAAVNPVLLGSLALTVPFGAWAAWKRRDAVAGFALVWAAANYLPYIPLAAVANRITYLYYFLPTVPALAMLAAVFLCRARLPRVVVWSYLALMVAEFIIYFPFRQPP